MKIYCRGFNLYNQLNYPEIVVPNFVSTIEENFIKTAIFSHSFSLVVSEQSFQALSNSNSKSLEKSLKYIGKISKISCNNTLVLVVNENSEIFKIKFGLPAKIDQLPRFTEKDHKISLISLGEILSVIYTENGSLYNVPEKLDFEGTDILEIKTGREHCLLLHANGDVYSFGRGSRGQLGHGSLEEQINPRIIEALAGIKIIHIAAGGWHSLALSIDGDVYSWGWNVNGQLGLSDDSNKEPAVQVMATPTLVEFDNPHNTEINVKKIACGVRHSLALLDNNVLYGCGWNKYKQLKEDSDENFYSFVWIHDFSNEKVCDVICGPWVSAVVCA